MLFNRRSIRESRLFKKKRFHRVKRYQEMLYSVSAMMGIQAILFVFLTILSYQTWLLVRDRFLDAGAIRYLLPLGILALGIFFLVRVRATYLELRQIRSELLAMRRELEDPEA